MTNQEPNIWLLQAKQDIDALTGLLKHTTPNVRMRAAAALRILDATDAVDALRTALDKEQDPQARLGIVAALDALAPTQDPAPSTRQQTRTERLIEHLEGDNIERAVQAARALSKIREKTAVPPLILAFRNPQLSYKVRLAAAEALLALNSAPAEVTLLAALRNRKWQIRRNGAAILGQLRADWAVEPIGDMLHDDNELVRRTARAALRRIDTPPAQAVLMKARQHLEDTARLDEQRLREAQQRLAESRSGETTVASRPEMDKPVNRDNNQRPKQKVLRGTDNEAPPHADTGPLGDVEHDGVTTMVIDKERMIRAAKEDRQRRIAEKARKDADEDPETRIMDREAMLKAVREDRARREAEKKKPPQDNS